MNIDKYFSLAGIVQDGKYRKNIMKEWKIESKRKEKNKGRRM
jgi:hypothetical protein